MSVRPLGDRAVRIDRPPGTSAAAVRAAVRAWPGALDVVVTEHHVGVIFAAAPVVDDAAVAALAGLRSPARPPRHVEIVARYDGEDLGAVAAAAGLSVEEAARLHAGTTYEVCMVGFLPGFAYLGDLPEPLRLPRRATPRPRVPAGAIGIAGRHTGVYPFASAGGWHLVGRALGPPLFHPERGALLAPGDHVRFVEGEAPGVAPLPPSTRDVPVALRVERALGLCTVQDLGRPGHAYEGVPAGGALVPGALAAANAALGNAPGAAAIEVLGRLVVRAEVDVGVATAAGDACILHAGERFTVDPERGRRARYLAVQGGVDVPLVLGSRSTLLAARLGGVEGRALRAGDAVARGDGAAGGSPAVAAAGEGEGPIRVLPGPDAGAFAEGALARFLATTWTVEPSSDRAGTRLGGGTIARRDADARPSAPMVPGAIEVPAGGEPIVLGPDGPTTGGYPVLAVVASDDLPRFHALALGALVRFVA